MAKIFAWTGIVISTTLLIIFLTLKLSDKVNRGWELVLLPLWAPVSYASICLLIGVLVLYPGD